MHLPKWDPKPVWATAVHEPSANPPAVLRPPPFWRRVLRRGRGRGVGAGGHLGARGGHRRAQLRTGALQLGGEPVGPNN